MALITLKKLLDHAAEHSYRPLTLNVNNIEQVTAVMQADEKPNEMVRKIIVEKKTTHAKHVKIIYGGGMAPDNAEAMLLMENIDGGLVGRCSIYPSTFIKICEIADRFKCGDIAE